jgi:hypothetical protein
MGSPQTLAMGWTLYVLSWPWPVMCWTWAKLGWLWFDLDGHGLDIRSPRADSVHGLLDYIGWQWAGLDTCWSLARLAMDGVCWP